MQWSFDSKVYWENCFSNDEMANFLKNGFF